MFVRKRGRRYLILHSYRDGRGKVCQRRLGAFVDAPGLVRQLAELPERCPEMAAFLPKLQVQAEALLREQSSDPERRAQRIRRTARLLSTYLAEESDPEVLRKVAPELHDLQVKLPVPESTPLSRSRARLSPRRRRYDPSDPQAQAYLQALDQEADHLTEQARIQEGAEVLAERVRLCPTADARLAYGALLQQLGRPKEAEGQYERVPPCHAARHYNCAALYWASNKREEALVHLMRGLTREPEVMQALVRMQQGKPIIRPTDYWQRFGSLWPPDARAFAALICAQSVVRHRLNNMLRRRVLVRELIPAHTRAWLLNLKAELPEPPRKVRQWNSG